MRVNLLDFKFLLKSWKFDGFVFATISVHGLQLLAIYDVYSKIACRNQ